MKAACEAMEAQMSVNDSSIESVATDPLDVLSLLSAVAAAATVAANQQISQQIAQTASNEINRAQTVLTSWLDSLCKQK